MPENPTSVAVASPETGQMGKAGCTKGFAMSPTASSNNGMLRAWLPAVFLATIFPLFWGSAVALEPRPGDIWLGKWSGAATYTETTEVFDWWFAMSLSCDGEYRIQTHTSGPEQVEIKNINASELEFLFHDKPDTHIQISLTDSDTYTGQVIQTHNTVLPRGRVDGERIEVYDVSIVEGRETCEGNSPGADIDAAEVPNTDAPPEQVAKSEEGGLIIKIAPLNPIAQGEKWRTGVEMVDVVSVTNSGNARIYSPRLEIALTGEAVSEHLKLEAGQFWKNEGPEADFFDISCVVTGSKARCPLGYGNQLEGGKTYLEPGETREIAVGYMLFEPGNLTVQVTALAERDGHIEAKAARSMNIVGPILGLRLISTTPPPYGYSENPRLPLHEGREITLRYAILASQSGGSAGEVELIFSTPFGEVISATTAKGERLPCGRMKVTDLSTIQCVIVGIAAGETVEVDAAFRYGRRFMAETYVSAGGSSVKHKYETSSDLDPKVKVFFVPPPPAMVAEGQVLYAEIDIANRGRGIVENAVLKLGAAGFGLAFKLREIKGCEKLEAAENGEGTACILSPFSGDVPRTIKVWSEPVPETAEGREVGLWWELKVPGHRFPKPSTSNEEGYIGVKVGPQIADLFVREVLPAKDIPPGLPQKMKLSIGNSGTIAQDDVTLDLRITVMDAGGAVVTGSTHLSRAEILWNRSAGNREYASVRSCELSSDTAVCNIGRLFPRGDAELLFEFNSGDLAEGKYRFDARISEGKGEAGDALHTKDNSVRGGAGIVATGESVDLVVFKDQSDQTAQSHTPQSFGIWVQNDGTLAQDNVALKLVFGIETNQALPSGLRFLSDVSAVIPGLGDRNRPTRRVPCIVAVGTASCALGRLAPEEAAHIFVDWNPHGVVGRYNYEAYVGEGAGEVANALTGDNSVTGGAEINELRAATVISNKPSGTVEYPANGDEVTRGSSMLGTFQNLEPGHELWYFTFSPRPQWYYLRPVEHDQASSGAWAIHDLSHGQPGTADIGYTYRIGILAANSAANARLQKDAARLAELPPGTVVLDEIAVIRIGE